jgi:hypothetical protein
LNLYCCRTAAIGELNRGNPTIKCRRLQHINSVAV